VSELEKFSELMRGLEIPPNAINGVSPSGFYAIGASIAAQAKKAVDTIPKSALVELAEKWKHQPKLEDTDWQQGVFQGMKYCAEHLLEVIQEHEQP